MNTKEDQPTQSIFEGAKHLLQGLPKVAAGVVGLSGFAYLIGWVYARSYFSVFGAEWLTTEISVLTLMGYSWVGWIKALSFTPNPPSFFHTIRLVDSLRLIHPTQLVIRLICNSSTHRRER